MVLLVLLALVIIGLIAQGKRKSFLWVLAAILFFPLGVIVALAKKYK